MSSTSNRPIRAAKKVPLKQQTPTGRSSLSGTPVGNGSIRDITENLQKNIDETIKLFKGTITKQITSFKSSIEEKIQALQTEVDSLQKFAEHISAEFDDLRTKVNENEAQQKEKNKQLSRSSVDSAMKATIGHIEGQLNRIEQQKLVNNIVISGVGKVGEPRELVQRIAAVLKTGTNQEDIIAVDIMNKKLVADRKSAAYSSYTLLVKCKHHGIKKSFLTKKKEIGKLFTGQLCDTATTTNDKRAAAKEIFFRDHLTRYSQKIYEEAKKIQNDNKIKFLWTNDGRILASRGPNQRTLELTSLDDVTKLSQQQPIADRSGQVHSNRHT